MNNRFYIAFTLSLALVCLTGAKLHKDAYRIKTIVIDAGHGGHDAGCLGASAREKHVALDIALKLGKIIESNHPDIKVVYTRKTDVFIPLHERANIANKAHADLFICIHLNSGGKAAFGAETYVMGNHKTEDNLEVAKRENAAILLEEDYIRKYDGFDPNSPEANIIFSLYQSQFMSQSILFASNIQDEFEDYAGRHNRGVKQAGFLVLYKTAMPAVLIECGFLSHDQEEKYLASDKGQHQMATAIYRAFKGYKLDMESGTEAPVSTQRPAMTEKKVESTAEKTPAPDTTVLEKTIAKDSLAIAKPTDPPRPLPKTVIPGPDPKPPVKTTPSIPVSVQAGSVFLAVQVGASKDPVADASKFSSLTEAKGIACDDGYIRFVVGNFTLLEDAKKKLATLKLKGYKDAFITAFDGKKRISVQEAEARLKRD